jgi:hypothetical protein
VPVVGFHRNSNTAATGPRMLMIERSAAKRILRGNFDQRHISPRRDSGVTPSFYGQPWSVSCRYGNEPYRKQLVPFVVICQSSLHNPHCVGPVGQVRSSSPSRQSNRLLVPAKIPEICKSAPIQCQPQSTSATMPTGWLWILTGLQTPPHPPHLLSV